MRWDEFAAAVPELAALGEERLRGRELCLVGTLRANGWPRISPVEPEFVHGELMLGMMWRSPKALDLLRDPRLVVHSVVSRRQGDEGDFKLYGRAVPVEQGERRDRYRATIKARIDWEPEEPNYHVFAVDIDSAGFVEFAPGHYGLAWDPDSGLRRWEQALVVAWRATFGGAASTGCSSTRCLRAREYSTSAAATAAWSSV